MIKISEMVKKTAEQKAALKAEKIQIGYKTILKILNNDIQGAEILPGSTLKLTVAAVVGDEFDDAVKSIGNDTLKVGGVSIWRSTTSRGVINVDGINTSDLDEDWRILIEMLEDRSGLI